MPSIVTNFKFKSSAPNFERDQLSYRDICLIGNRYDPKSTNDNRIPINPFEWYDVGHIVYCPDRHRYYSFASNYDPSTGLIKLTETDPDPDTGLTPGLFSIFNSGSGSSSDEYGNSAYRNVWAFKSSKEKPDKPRGWKYDVILQKPIPSGDGWTVSDSELQPPIWMSIGEFNVNFPDEETWTEPVKVTGEDGRPGSDGKTMEFIYTRSYTEDDGPMNIPTNNTTIDDFVPGPWVDKTGVAHAWLDNPEGVNQTFQCEWMCQRFKYDHRTQEEIEAGVAPKVYWGGWNEKMTNPKPILWSKWGVYGKDGDGVEYIYNVTYENNPSPLPPMTSDYINSEEYQKDEYKPNGNFIIDGVETTIGGWTDDPTGVTPEEPYEWVSIRRFNRNTGKWGAFSDPVLWAHFGKEGFKSFVFCRTNETPVTPIDEIDENGNRKTNYSNPIPVDPSGKVIWTDGIPDGDSMVWMSSKYFFNDHTDAERPWSKPTQMTDTADFDVEFHDGEEFPANDPGRPGQPNKNPRWKNTADVNTVWMATSTCKNGVWTEWSIVKIKGEKGNDGTSINIMGHYGTYEELVGAEFEGTLAKGAAEHNHPDGPTLGDAYVVSLVNIDIDENFINPFDNDDYNELGGKMPTPVRPTTASPTDPNIAVLKGALFTWDGDSWVFLGKFQGDAAYVHIKYSPNPDVMKIEWEVDEKTGDLYVKEETKLTNFPTQDLWELPINKQGKTAKYIGTYTDNELKDSLDVNKYKWSKFIGEDGFGYEYIYMLSKTEKAPTIPSETPPIRDEYQTEEEFIEAYKKYHSTDHVPEMPEGWDKENSSYVWWTDEPSGTSAEYPFEWQAWRIWQQGVDEWSEWRGSQVKDEETGLPLAILHTVWHDAGFTSFAFTRTNSDLSGWDMKDVTGTYKNPLPTMKDADDIVDGDDTPGVTEYNGQKIIWSDSVPAPNEDNPYEIVWMTSAKFNLGVDGVNTHAEWSVPREMTDTSDLDIDWCPYEITDPGNPDDNPENWWETPYLGYNNDNSKQWPSKIIDNEAKPDEPVWMATRKLKNGEPIKGEPWIITRVKGEKGDPGTDGTSVKIKGTYKYYKNENDKENSLYYNWLGIDLREPWQNDDGEWEDNDGTLWGDNPPKEFDAYTVELYYGDKDHEDYTACGDLYVYTPTADGDPWVNVGKFKGDPGLPTYTHIKYCPDAGVLDKPIQKSDGTLDTEEFLKQKEEYNNKYNCREENGAGTLWEVPVKEIDGDIVPAKYIGMCSNNNLEDPVEAFEYTWNKFVGDDGFGYEYIYMRTNDSRAPQVPLGSDPKDGAIPVKPQDWLGDTWWSDKMTGVDIENKYEWMCYRKKFTNTKGVYTWGPWVGADGQTQTGDNNAVATLINYYSEKEYTTICALDVEPVTIKINKYGEYSSETINVKIFTKKGNEKYQYNGEDGAKVPEGYHIIAYYKNAEDTVVELDISDTLSLNVKDLNPIDRVVNIGLFQDNEDGEGTTRLDYETIPLLKDESNIVTDLTNDRYAITCNNFGQPVNTGEVAETAFKMYYGLDEVELSQVNLIYDDKVFTLSTVNDNIVTEIDSNDLGSLGIGKIEFKLGDDKKSAILKVSQIDENAALAMNFKFEAEAIVDSKTVSGSAIFIVNKIVPGGKTPTLYQMIPSASIIAKDENGANTPTSINVKVVKIEGTTDNEQSKTTTLDVLDEGLSIKAYKDGVDLGQVSYQNGVSNNVDTKNTATSIEFKLLHGTDETSYGEIHDLYIPVVNDGITPTIYQIKPSITTVRMKSDGSYLSSSINFDLKKVHGNQVITLSGSTASNEGKWKYGIDGKDATVEFTGPTLDITSLKPQTMITVDFIQNNVITDRVMIPVVTDGRAGETTTIYSLNSSANTITVAKDGTMTPSSINASVLYASGGQINSLTDVVGNIKLFAVVNKGSERYYLNSSGITNTKFNEASPDNTKSITYGTSVKGWISSDKSVEFYLYKDNILIDKESIPILSDGESGASANLTNDMIAIQCDENGKPTVTSSYTTTFELYYGTEKLTLTSLVSNITSNPTVSCNTNGTVTISNYGNIADTVEVKLTGSGKNSAGTTITLSKTLKVVKVKKGSTGGTGSPGNGIKSFTEYYALSTTNSAPSGSGTNGSNINTSIWSTTSKIPDNTNRYLWNFEVIEYTNGSKSSTSPKIISVYGERGADGAGVNSTAVSYAVTDNYRSDPQNITGWTSTMPSASSEKYLWTRTIIDYTDNSVPDTVTYTYSYQGKNGTAGTSVSITSIQYQASSSATTAPTGTWSNSVVTVQEGYFLWTKTTFSDGKVAYSVAKQGAKGNTGATGAGISSITEYYKATTSSTAAPSSWVTNVADSGFSETNRYLWNYTKTTYTEGKQATETTPMVIGVWGSAGTKGAAGLVIYPAGEWKSGTTYSQSATATPFVYKYVNNSPQYYVLDVSSSSKDPASSTDWMKMESYNAIYADIGVFGNALVGKAVFNDKWMFSQLGVGEYKYFDPSLDDPYTNTEFKPAWCVDLLNGNMWAGGGNCKFASDGSGELAGGNIYWDNSGNMYLPPVGDISYNYVINNVNNQKYEINYSLKSGGNLSKKTNLLVWAGPNKDGTDPVLSKTIEVYPPAGGKISSTPSVPKYIGLSYKLSDSDDDYSIIAVSETNEEQYIGSVHCSSGLPSCTNIISEYKNLSTVAGSPPIMQGAQIVFEKPATFDSNNPPTVTYLCTYVQASGLSGRTMRVQSLRGCTVTVYDNPSSNTGGTEITTTGVTFPGPTTSNPVFKLVLTANEDIMIYGNMTCSISV